MEVHDNQMYKADDKDPLDDVVFSSVYNTNAHESERLRPNEFFQGLLRDGRIVELPADADLSDYEEDDPNYDENTVDYSPEGKVEGAFNYASFKDTDVIGIIAPATEAEEDGEKE